MDNSNNPLRNKLRENPSLPDDLRWSEMENEILAKMPVGNTPVNALGNVFPWTLFISSQVVIAAIICFTVLNINSSVKGDAYVWQQKKDNQATLNANTLKRDKNTKPEIESLQIIDSQENNSTVNLEINKSPLPVNKKDKPKHELTNTQLNTSSSENIITPIIKQQNNNQTETSLNKTSLQTSSVLNNASKQIIKEELNAKQEIKVNEESISFNKYSEKVKSIATIKQDLAFNNSIASLSKSISQLNYTIKIPSLEFSAFEIKEKEYSPKPKKSRVSLGLGAGATYWLPQFSGEELANFKSFEKGIASYQSTISGSYHINDIYRIRVGLSYTSMEGVLDYYEERDSSVNVLVDVKEVNSLNNEVLDEYQINKLVPAVSWTHIKHYNDYKWLSIPVSVHALLGSYKKFGIEGGIGFAYSYLLSGKGKTFMPTAESLNYKDIKTFNALDQYKRSLISSSVQIDLLYAINEKIGLNLGLSANYGFSNLSKDISYNFKSHGIQQTLGFYIKL